MSILSGKQGSVAVAGHSLAEITLWSFKTFLRHVAYTSSATGGYRGRLPGVREGSGRFQFLLDPANPASAGLQDGAEVTLALCLDENRCYSVPAVVDAVQIETDISGGGLVAGSAEFSTNGAWTEPEIG